MYLNTKNQFNEKKGKIYISSSGYKTHNISNLLNHTNNTDGIKWNAIYDGNKANIDLDLVRNNNKQHYNMSLNNMDLQNLYNNVLSHQMINIPLEERLMNDFQMRLPQTSLSSSISAPLLQNPLFSQNQQLSIRKRGEKGGIVSNYRKKRKEKTVKRKQNKKKTRNRHTSSKQQQQQQQQSPITLTHISTPNPNEMLVFNKNNKTI